MYTRSIESPVVRLLQRCYGRNFCQAPRGASNGRRSLTTGVSTKYKETTRSVKLNLRRHGAALSCVGSRSLHSTATLAQSAKTEDVSSNDIAVLGGGITGLTTAYHLSRELPEANITLYEGSDRLGGWLRSTPQEVQKGTIVFESGPRTLRPSSPAALPTLELIGQLGLEDQLIIVDQNSFSAQNRYIYYPDRLVHLPFGGGMDFYSRVWTIFSEPLFQGWYSGLLLEYFREKRSSNIEDESVGAFLARRTGGQQIGDNLVSAVLHGIYAGDINQLSIKSLMPKLFWLEEKFGSVSRGFLSRFSDKIDWISEKEFDQALTLGKQIPQSLKTALSTSSVYTFKQGIGQLATSIEQHLKTKPNVHFKLNDKIQSCKYVEGSDKVQISSYGNQEAKTFNTVISTLSAKNTAALAVDDALPSLASQHAVTVMTVNLYFQDPDLLHERGFGYLIPRSIPYEQNPECALGVVFDSDSSIGQDTATGTKLTVMMGGHWWDHLASTNGYPTEEEGLEMAKAVLKRHLKIEDEPEAWQVRLHKDCIPQYTVGHDQRMKTASGELKRAFRGRLRVAGNSYAGVGLNDCVKSARDVVFGLKEESTSPWAPVRTGLEEFVMGTQWVPKRLP